MLLLNQGKMQLNETALKFTSEQLNTLAKKKEDLEKYLNDLNYQPQSTEAIKEQVLFVENQIRLLMQGWAKATPATKKRLLRRTIKEIIITRSEIHICFWLNASELGFGRDEASGASPEDADKIIPLRRISPQASDRNLSILSSGKKGFGRLDANVIEPTELSIGRAYKVKWKKEKPTPEELARLYWVEGLTQQQVAARFRVRRATVAKAVKKFEEYFNNTQTVSCKRNHKESAKGFQT